MNSKKNKKKKPKVNPLDISQAKAKAVKNTILMAEYVLQSKHGFDRDQIVEFLENMAYVADAVQEGRLNMTDINNANRQEIHLNTTSDIYQKSVSSGRKPITFYGPLVVSDSEHPCNIPLKEES